MPNEPQFAHYTKRYQFVCKHLIVYNYTYKYITLPELDLGGHET